MEKKFKQIETNHIPRPSMLNVTNFSPKKIKVSMKYDEKYEMWRVDVKLRGKKWKQLKQSK